MLKKFKILLILIICSGHFYSCSKINKDDLNSRAAGDLNKKGNLNSAGVKEGEHEFSVQYQQPRRIYRLDKEDLNNDGNKEIIIMSVLIDTAEKFSSYYNFDMIEVFALNTERNSYIKILSDTVDYSKDCSYIELGKDKRRQILISTSSGGNDDIMSTGMFIYNMTSSDSIKLLKYFDSGAPEVRDIKNDGINEILVSDVFYGVMPHVDAVKFVKEIYKLENQELVERNSEFSEFFDLQISKAKNDYYGLKRNIEVKMQPNTLSYPLYREAAEVIINYYAKGDEKNLRIFWDEEKESLRRNIPENEFMDLNNFMSKALPTAKNA